MTATVIVALLALPHTTAGFTDTDTSAGNTWGSDTLDAPTALTAAGGAAVTLNWTATTDTYATGHRIYRSTTAGGPYTQIAQITPRTNTSYVDSLPAVAYYYVVRAFHGTWESANSNEVSVTVSALTVAAVADTYIDEQLPSANYGTDIIDLVRTWDPAQNARSFLQFDVTAIPPGSAMSSATLTLCPSRADAVRQIEIHRVTGIWSELGLTWSNQPSIVATATDSITQPATLDCVVYTVTSDVQAWVDGTTNYGWRLADTVENDIKLRTEYRSRENPLTGERPKLEVTYTY